MAVHPPCLRAGEGRVRAREWREWRAVAYWQLELASALASGGGAGAWRPRACPGPARGRPRPTVFETEETDSVPCTTTDSAFSIDYSS